MTVDRDTELWRESEQREKAGGKAVLFLLFVLAALAGGAYVAAYLTASDKVPRGTTVAGVAVGGHTQDEAVALLERELATTVATPIDVTVGDLSRGVVPETAGLSVDYEASIEAAGRATQLVARVAVGLLHRGRRPRRGGGRRRAHPGGVPRRARRRGRATRPRGCGRPRLRPRQGDPAPRGHRPRPRRRRRSRSTPRSWSTRRTGRRCPSRWCRCPPRSTTPTSATPSTSFANPAMSAPVVLTFGDARVRLTPTRVRRRPVARAAGRCPGAGPRHRPARRPGRRCGLRQWGPGRRHGPARRRAAPGRPGPARGDLRPRGRARRLPGPGHPAPGRARARGRLDGGQAGVHHQGRQGARDHRAGVHVHDVLPLRGVPQHQHRPRGRAGRRHRR